YNRVKFYRKDMQGAADSVIFAQSDSLIHMYKDPILWSENLQITGDTIQIKSLEGSIENLYVFDHAFMVNKIDSVMYNQIKGKRLTGHFRDNELYKVFIRGNGQSLYYASEERKVKVSVDDTTQILSPDPSLADTSLAIHPSDTTLVKDSTILEYSDLVVDSMAVKPDTIVKSNLSSATDSVFIREQIYIGVNKS